MENDDANQPKGFNISKLVVDSAHDHSLAAALAKQVAVMQVGSSPIQEVLQIAGGLSAKEQASKALGPYLGLQRQFNPIARAGHFPQIAAQQDMVKSLLPEFRGHLSAVSGVSDLQSSTKCDKGAMASITALPKSWDDIFGLSTSARLAEDMHKRLAIYQPTSALTNLRKDVFAEVNMSMRALALPQFKTLIAPSMARISGVLSNANVFKSLGLPSVLDNKMHSVSSLLNEQMSTFTAAARAPILPSDAFGAIEELLARSLKAQEALLAEHRANEADAVKEANFHRCMAILAAVINILMFLMTVALQLEDLLSDDEAVVRDNTRAIGEMSESFGTMAVQIEGMQAAQEKANEAEQAADAAIVDVLRDIAETLKEQVGSVGNDQGEK